MGQASRDLPTGTVTFLFTDIEGSTDLAQRLDPGTYREVLEQHNRLLRTAFTAHGGVERGTQGDAFLVVFRDAPSGVSAAVEAPRALAAATTPDGLEITVRMGAHSGQGILGGDDYVGVDINRAARIAAAAHGGQVLLSEPTRALAERSLPAGLTCGRRSAPVQRPRTAERIHQVSIRGLRTDFPPVRSLSRNLTGARLDRRLFLGASESSSTSANS
jgi:class 3 adenylate cyclase